MGLPYFTLVKFFVMYCYLGTGYLVRIVAVSSDSARVRPLLPAKQTSEVVDVKVKAIDMYTCVPGAGKPPKTSSAAVVFVPARLRRHNGVRENVL